MSRREAVDGLWESALSGAHPGFTLVNAALSCVPAFAGGWLRARLYRRVGMDVSTTAFIMGNVAVRAGTRGHLGRIHIGHDALVSTDVTLNSDDDITVGDNATLGPFVRIYTSTHAQGPSSRRCDPAVVTRPVVIGAGSWLAIGVTVLPGVTIGRGAVIAAGAVVAEDVPPDSYAGGVPARVLRTLDGGALPEVPEPATPKV